MCVVSSLAACVAPNWGVASLRRVLCGWPALVGWRFLCVCGFDGFLLWVRIAYACPTTASLCNTVQNGSTRTRPKAAGSGKKHPMHTGAAETKQHTALGATDKKA